MIKCQSHFFPASLYHCTPLILVNQQKLYLRKNRKSFRDLEIHAFQQLKRNLFFFRVGLSIFECSLTSKMQRCGDRFCPPLILMCLVPVSHLFLVINSSVNIIIYCIAGDGFRYVEIVFINIISVSKVDSCSTCT